MVKTAKNNLSKIESDAIEIVAFIALEDQKSIFNCLHSLNRLSLEYIQIVGKNNFIDWEAINSIRYFLESCHKYQLSQSSKSAIEAVDMLSIEDPNTLFQILNAISEMMFTYFQHKDLTYDFVDWKSIDLIRYTIERCHEYQNNFLSINK